MAYLNCPECFYRVRTKMARKFDGETSCPRCARHGRLISMYSTPMALRPEREAPLGDPGELTGRISDSRQRAL